MNTLKDFLSACIEVDQPNGDITWSTVDLDTSTVEGKFTIFNTYTGQNELFDNLSLAKTKWDSLKAKITIDYLTPPAPLPTTMSFSQTIFENPSTEYIDNSPDNMEIL
jgi:hypothetical protein